jgi:hypothetical protein
MTATSKQEVHKADTIDLEEERAKRLQQRRDRWPEPIDFTQQADGTASAVRFPIELLPESLRAFVKDTTERMGSLADLVAIPALAGAGAMLGREVWIQVKQEDDGWRERPALWAMTIAPPSSMKTPCARAALKPVEKLQNDLRQEWRERLESAESAEDGKPTTRRKGPPPETILFHEGTGEAVIRVMSPEHNWNGARGALLHRDELAGWLAGMNKYRAGDDRQLYLQAWSGGPFTLHLVKGIVHVPDCFLCLFGTMQPEVAHKIFGEATEDGMTARFGLVAVVAMAGQPAWVDRPANKEIAQAYARRLRELREVLPQTLTFSPAAGRLFESWYCTLMGRPELHEDNGFAFHLAKYPSLFARLVLVFHFLEHGRQAPQQISIETAEAVRRFIDEYLEPHARRLYGLVGAHVLRAGAVRVARWIRAKRIEQFRARDIRRMNWKEFNCVDDTRLIDATLRYLEAQGWIELREKPTACTGGRPTIDAIVNPRIWEPREEPLATAD